MASARPNQNSSYLRRLGTYLVPVAICAMAGATYARFVGNWPETTALGAAYLAGLAVGYWGSTGDIQSQWTAERTFNPEMDDAGRKAAHDRWQRAVRATLSWAEDR